MSQMPPGPLKEVAGDTLAFSTLLGNDDREKETESMKSVSDISVQNSKMPWKSSFEATGTCTCCTIAPITERNYVSFLTMVTARVFQERGH